MTEWVPVAEGPGEKAVEIENELKQEVGRTSLQSTLIFQALAEGGQEEERVR